MADQVEPPVNLAAEVSVIGSMLLSRDAIAEVSAIVRAGDFYRGAHRTMFDAARDLYARGETIDAVTLSDELDRRGQLADAGGALAIADLLDKVPTAVNAAHYARIVADMARRRRVQEAARALVHEAADLSTPLDVSVAGRVDTMLAARSGTGVVRVADVAEQVWEIHEHGRASRGRPAGIRDLDRIYKAAPGQLSVVTGVPGHGKSTFVSHLMYRLSLQHGWRHAVFSPEQAPIADHVAVLAQLYMGQRFDDAPADKVADAIAWVGRHFEWVNHEEHANVAAILAQVRVIHDQRPVHTFLLDPWTELDNVREKGVREDEYISAELTRIRQFARHNDIHTFVVAHPKQMEKRLDGTWPVPSSADLHGGSVWRKKADMLLAVWRDELGVNIPPPHVEVHIQKVRHNGIDGEMGRKATLVFDATSGRYHAFAGETQSQEWYDRQAGVAL